MFEGIGGNLAHYMSLVAARQKLAASNIANADTPGFKTKDIDFSAEFEEAFGNHVPSVHEVQGLSIKPDGNNVDIDRESRLLAENALRFSIASSMLRGQLRSVRLAIQEGKSE